MDAPTMLASLATLAIAHLLACASPGPSFIFVAQSAASRSRRAGLLAALGMSAGATVWAAGALLGLAALFERVAELYRVAQIAGGLYLVYIAYRIAQHAKDPLPAPGSAPAATDAQIFLGAMRVQLANPKVSVFFASIFITVLPRDASLAFRLAVLLMVIVDETLWYSFVATVLSTSRARTVYGRFKTTADRITGAFLGLLGFRLVLQGARAVK
ncbi:LysE family transporter [Pendulispora rubella]|uniref:LysE family transporter n=1 Tax=Pendulispora rubella TaxID=2741070 RepID=A0ABZ2L2P6_9BACT